ncbi:MAG: 50S ribosomal protein L30 [Legionellales bacterium]|nr:50S ribosomal protein L30 [Legionellales bacterium]|tara:strand:- start:17003 stop:17197 length:195 start_codon:yes stop_codon:yes gene_type:complete
MSEKTITIQLVKSVIGQNERVRATVRGLGLRKIGSTKTLLAKEQIIGMVNKVQHLVKLVSKDAE